ncbi:hypothetical protein H0H81_011018 [Sphagnurus paluster]|uniref:Uncharacterized protein n=1 Tax=Sphagnurus paluster TaxID=117069 RepID=A0A9P7GIT7_9AGAR|nr:hypothetical protein H0H81_011018 [Sphagnurus paluster]
MDDSAIDRHDEEHELQSTSPPDSALSRFRASYHGALIFNLAAFFIPAVYGTLSKLWVANIDSSLVSTLDAYTYLSCVVEVLNEGLPRAAWYAFKHIIRQMTRFADVEYLDPADVGPAGWKIVDLLERLSLTFTLISVQSLLGTVLSIVFLFAAPAFVGAYVPGETRAVSVKYIRILAFDSVASTLNTAVSFGTRALDKPEQVASFTSRKKDDIDIFLELALVSTVRVGGFEPTIHTVATIKLVCDLAGAIAGLLYFLYLVKKTTAKQAIDTRGLRWFSAHSLKKLALPGRWTFTESAVRNAI